MSIKIQVILLMVVSLVLLALISTYVSSSKSKEALLKANDSRLSMGRDLKKNQIQNFFSERIGDIEVLARSQNLEELVKDLINVHNELEVQAGDAYPVQDPLAVQKTKKHETFFQGYMKDYGYYDVFVICAKHGHVMYSGTKESDYGANLTSGSLKESGLAQAYKEALKNGRPTFVDMKPYAPS